MMLHPLHEYNRRLAARAIADLLRQLNDDTPVAYEAVVEFASDMPARRQVERELGASKDWSDETWELAAVMSQAACDEREREDAFDGIV